MRKRTIPPNSYRYRSNSRKKRRRRKRLFFAALLFLIAGCTFHFMNKANFFKNAESPSEASGADKVDSPNLADNQKESFPISIAGNIADKLINRDTQTESISENTISKNDNNQGGHIPSGSEIPYNSQESTSSDKKSPEGETPSKENESNTHNNSEQQTVPDDDKQKDPDEQEKTTPDDSDNNQEEDADNNEEFNFENTLFIGDSRTEGLFINTGLTDATFYAVRGLTVENIYTNKFVQLNSKKKKYTILSALKRQSFRKIYIMLGINELGWAYEDVFIEKYATLIEDIQKLQPDAEIIVQSILPVTKEKSDNDAIFKNEKIYLYNKLIKEMAEEENVTYADLFPAIADEDGVLPEEGASDGVHLTKSYYLKWLDYLISQKI